jgi:hypothetical protein
VGAGVAGVPQALKVNDAMTSSASIRNGRRLFIYFSSQKNKWGLGRGGIDPGHKFDNNPNLTDIQAVCLKIHNL